MLPLPKTFKCKRNAKKVPKVLMHFLPKYLVNIWAFTKFTSRMSKMRGGGSWPLLDNVQKKNTFLWLPLVALSPLK